MEVAVQLGLKRRKSQDATSFPLAAVEDLNCVIIDKARLGWASSVFCFRFNGRTPPPPDREAQCTPFARNTTSGLCAPRLAVVG